MLFRSLFDSIGYQPIGLLHLSVCLRVRHRCIVERDVVLFAERRKFFGCEVSPIICDDAVGHPEAIYLMNWTAVVAVELVMGTASIHLVNLSTAANKCVCPPLEDFLSGPTISSPHWANGQANGIVFNADAGACGFVADRKSVV